MRRVLLLAAMLLSSCSGGGSRPFQPSANLAQTHPWLLGFWPGQLTRNGMSFSSSLTFDAVTGIAAGPNTEAEFTSEHPGTDLGTADVQAEVGSDRVRWTHVAVIGGNVTTLRFQGAIADRYLMTGTWTLESTLPSLNGLSGSGEFARLGGPMPSTTTTFVYDVETPDLRLRIVERHER